MIDLETRLSDARKTIRRVERISGLIRNPLFHLAYRYAQKVKPEIGLDNLTSRYIDELERVNDECQVGVNEVENTRTKDEIDKKERFIRVLHKLYDKRVPPEPQVQAEINTISEWKEVPIDLRAKFYKEKREIRDAKHERALLTQRINAESLALEQLQERDTIEFTYLRAINIVNQEALILQEQAKAFQEYLRLTGHVVDNPVLYDKATSLRQQTETAYKIWEQAQEVIEDSSRTSSIGETLITKDNELLALLSTT